jgi:Cu/Ag efflux pump CusA
MSVPEVENVLGKAGSAYTATDNAPMSMIESIIVLKPKSEWREGMTTEKLITELNDKVQIPGVNKRLDTAYHQPYQYAFNRCANGHRHKNLRTAIRYYLQHCTSN